MVILQMRVYAAFYCDDVPSGRGTRRTMAPYAAPAIIFFSYNAIASLIQKK
jgi:hypothetical protein